MGELIRHFRILAKRASAVENDGCTCRSVHASSQTVHPRCRRATSLQLACPEDVHHPRQDPSTSHNRMTIPATSAGLISLFACSYALLAQIVHGRGLLPPRCAYYGYFH